MKKILKLGLFFGLVMPFVCGDSFAATKTTTKKQSAIQMGTKVRARVEAKGVFNQDCYDAYYSCMDQFCIVDNEMGGSCNCSDDVKQYETALSEIKQMLSEAERISTEEVEKVKAGANADIIFSGTRTYDKNNNVNQTTATKDKNVAGQSLWSSFYDEDEEEDEEFDYIADKTGTELYKVAQELCREQMDSSCDKDMTILTQIYARQIVSDCKGLANSIEQKRTEARTALASANSSVRAALKESLEESNRYDRGTCMVEYKKCMKSADACGSDWGNCVFTIASENMQNNASTSVAGTKVKTIDTYDITASTMEILESKRFICENVLDKCVAVRDYVWNDFLREAAPTIRLAEQNIESQKRQSCLTDISSCIQKACKDDIVGKGVATMDACLARPSMARSFCKVQIEPCERMEPQIWDYVESKLAAMRVDACTNEVKECFTSEDRCGKDFVNCIGMDFDYIHDICPIDKLVVCKQSNPDFKMEDLDSMLMGLYLNIDNKALEQCTNLAEQKMVELCGSTTDCNTFSSDEYIGAGSVKSQKDGAIYRVTGMISFGSIKMGDAMGTVKDGGRVLAPGEIGVADYIKHVKEQNAKVPNADVIIANIEEELNNIAGTINRTISLIESDQQIQYCINGRDLSQIRKNSNASATVARFPNLVNQYRVAIGASALRKAQDNYNKKVNEAIATATRESSVDIAQYMCQMIPSGGGTGLDNAEQTPLNVPYAISYDVGTGLDLKSLTSGGKDISNLGGGLDTSYDKSRSKSKDMSSVSASITLAGAIGGAKKKSVDTNKNNIGSISMDGLKKEITAVFNREDRICHVCTTISTEDCEKLKIKATKIRKDKCQTTVKETCEDIKM